MNDPKFVEVDGGYKSRVKFSNQIAVKGHWQLL
jgi:hypothetical protein